MSLSLAIAINVLADVALIAGLAYAMSRPARLNPHVASMTGADAQTAAGLTPVSPQPQSVERPGDAHPVRDRTPVAQRAGARRTAAASANR